MFKKKRTNSKIFVKGPFVFLKILNTFIVRLGSL